MVNSIRNKPGKMSWLGTTRWTTGGFAPVSKEILENGRRTFESDRVSDQQTLETIRSCYEQIKYVLDPHTAVGVTVAKRSMGQSGSQIHHIAMSTAHPAKFSEAVKLALKQENNFDFEKTVLPLELSRLNEMEKRVSTVENSWETVREIVKEQVAQDMSGS